MELIRSNRTENLADALAARIRKEPLGPLEREVIVVQSRGMERWLTLALAERLGIWSHASFPFPRTVIEDALGTLDGERSDNATAYEPNHLKWSIAELLHESAPESLRSYLGKPPDPDRTLRFAGAVAQVFDDYTIYRPDLLKGWTHGADSEWQADLWRRVSAQLGPHDLASRIERGLHALRGKRAKSALPFRRLHLFSLETLPPLFLAFFSQLSREVETTLYLLEPCSKYHGDLDSRSVGLRTDHGHAFLSDVGRLSRDFRQLLMRFDELVSQREDRFESPNRHTLLGSVQADILELRSPPLDGARTRIEASDPSISIHACAGPMREAQTLHDLVRAALEDDPSLQPEDIVVMTPDIETYAPVFRAVFGQEEGPRIPYEVHDRRTREDAAFFEDFFGILDVLDSRFSVLDLVRVMDTSSLREPFRFTQEERARLALLLSDAGVRWGIDAEHRAALGFPAEDLHTWRAGFGRLFLGFASEADATGVFETLLPRGTPTLADAALIARLSRLCEMLFELYGKTRKPLHIAQWADLLELLISALFTDDDVLSPAALLLRQTLADLRTLTSYSNYTESVPLKTVRRELGALLVRGTPAVGFLRRGVTLTELIPLRSVPFRLVCLLGMSEDVFPRKDDRPSFNRMRDEHRLGDRHKRHDDRHTFLQAILCARDRLIVTYSSPPNVPNTGSNPSPVVWELADTVNRYYQRSDGRPALEATTHPLHAFDSRYFDGAALPRSSSHRHLRVAQVLAEPPIGRPRVELRADPHDQESTLSVAELTRWLWNPMTTFIDQVLQASFRTSALYEPAQALTTIGPLEKWAVGDAALGAGLRGEALSEYLAAAPEFPDGTGGRLQRQMLQRQISSLRECTERLHRGRKPSSQVLSVALGDLIVEDRLDGLFDEQRVVQRFTKTARRGELFAWVEHLLLHAATGRRRPTHLVLRDHHAGSTVVSFAPPNAPLVLLGELLELYRQCRQAPVPLLETASRKFAESYDESEPLKAARAARNELKDRAKYDARLAYLYSAYDPFSDEAWTEAFQRAALAVYGPLLRHRSER